MEAVGTPVPTNSPDFHPRHTFPWQVKALLWALAVRPALF